MSRESFAVEVAVFAPLRKTFHYLPPAGSLSAAPGTRVRVPFGRGVRVGVVLGRAVPEAVPRRSLKAIIAIIDGGPVFGPELMRLGHWAADYYQHPIGEVFAAMLPGPLRKGRPPVARQTNEWVAEGAKQSELATLARRAPRQAAVLALLGEGPAVAADFEHLDFDWRRALRELEKKGIVGRRLRSLNTKRPPTHPVEPVALNAAQTKAARSLISSFDSFRAFLLHGVTGSGKTEVYMTAMGKVLDRGMSGLLLVPEIVLTRQMVVRLRQRFGDAVGVLHSGLTDLERAQVWQRCRDGEVKVLMGTRSAVWAPLKRLGIVVVDEEHDASFKQQEGFRYNARDVAIIRAQQAAVPIVLGTATPSLEAYLNVKKRKYTYLSLPQRAGAAQLPKIRCIDVRGVSMVGGLSDPLLRAVSDRLERNEQTLLFINRRGFAPVMLCHQCGWIATCSRCDAKLVWHKERKLLVCHHCGGRKHVRRIAPCCDEPELIPLGLGTEQVEEALNEVFPGKNVARIDRDSMRRRNAMEEVFAAIGDGSVDILIGTQMLAKGHDFPRVTLVGIVDADSQLFSTDFRAEEKLAQMIIQVSGRAGRAEALGQVLIQTHHPHHELLQTLIGAGYDSFAKRALAERRSAALPPYVPMALVRAEAASPRAPHDFLAELARNVKGRGPRGLEVLGPIPAAMERRAGRYRAQLMLSANARGVLAAAIKSLIDASDEIPARRKVRWSVDVDPQDTT